MHQIVVWLVNSQWIGAAKTGEEEGRPNGYYGEVYAGRRKHTAVTHPDWSKMHSRMDALRYTLKRYLRELWKAWRAAEKGQAAEASSTSVAVPARADDTDQLPRRQRRARTGQRSIDTPSRNAGGARRKKSRTRTGRSASASQEESAGGAR
jgi:hypothetical protein